MTGEIIVRPWRCTGCSTCTLTCSLVHHGVFDTGRANIRIHRNEFAGTFELQFSSTCNGCKQCARVCPSGALQLVDTPDEKEREASDR